MNNVTEKQSAFGISVLVSPLKEDGTYTVQIANNTPITINDSETSRDKFIDDLDRMK